MCVVLLRVQSLAKWSTLDDKALSVLLEELMVEYRKHHLKILSQHQRYNFELSSLAQNEKYPEVYVLCRMSDAVSQCMLTEEMYHPSPPCDTAPYRTRSKILYTPPSRLCDCPKLSYKSEHIYFVFVFVLCLCCVCVVFVLCLCCVCVVFVLCCVCAVFVLCLCCVCAVFVLCLCCVVFVLCLCLCCVVLCCQILCTFLELHLFGFSTEQSWTEFGFAIDHISSSRCLKGDHRALSVT